MRKYACDIWQMKYEWGMITHNNIYDFLAAIRLEAWKVGTGAIYWNMRYKSVRWSDNLMMRVGFILNHGNWLVIEPDTDNLSLLLKLYIHSMHLIHLVYCIIHCGPKLYHSMRRTSIINIFIYTDQSILDPIIWTMVVTFNENNTTAIE